MWIVKCLVLLCFIKVLKQISGLVVPDVVVQYGVPRTATTLQYQILCVMMAVLHEDEINSVECNFNKTKSHRYAVVKTHELTESVIRSLPKGSWIFMTSSNKLSSRAKLRLNLSLQKIRQYNMSVPYIANVEMVSRRGYYITYEYQSIFGISDKAMKYVMDYMQYWEILRRCCGKQMSSDWLNHLSPMEDYKVHHDQHSVTYPACEMYKIGKVERQLMDTYIFKKFAYSKSLKYSIGGVFDGNFCERCNENIIKKRLQFNEDCH